MTEGQSKSRKKSWTLIAVLVIGVFMFSTIIVFAVDSWSLRPVSTPFPVVTSSPAYLRYPSGNTSRIFLVSATSTFGKYPFASAASPIPRSVPVIKKGDPCFIINATVENGYTLENLPPNEVPQYYSNGTGVKPTASVFVFLTATIYDKQGNVIQATDVTPPYGFANGGAYAFLQSGQNEMLSIYLATSQKDIDHYAIVIRYVGNNPLP